MRHRSEQGVGRGTTPADFGYACEDGSPHTARSRGQIFSPNTPVLRTHRRRMPSGNSGCIAQRARQSPAPTTGAEVSPNLSERELEDIAEVAGRYQVDAIAATNTTLDRPIGLRSTNSGEIGGLSGKPLAPRSVSTVRKLVELVEGRIAIIAAGGILPDATCLPPSQRARYSPSRTPASSTADP